jgi:hypothetical protein
MAYGTVNADVIGTSVAGSNIGAGNASLMKNRIINGAMVIDQRNAGASVTIVAAATTYTLDRFLAYADQASKFSVQQNAGSVTTPIGFPNYLGCTSLSAYSVGAGEAFIIGQQIEGFNTADLGWGTANAKTVTLSFQVYSSLTGTFGGSLRNSAANRSYPFSYSIPVANTWTTISVTIAGDTSGTWVGATNGIGIRLIFGLGVGSTYSGTAGSWSANNYLSTTGATSVVGTSGATFYITGVQLEVGSSATGYEYRQYGQELALCQRYAQKWIGNGAGSTQGNIAQGQSTNTTNASISLATIVPMRTTPTASFLSLIISDSATYDLAVSSINSVVSNGLSLYLDITNAATASTFRPCALRPASSSSGYLLLTSEL